jgi:Caspase domain/Protein of unknown function (DUF1566)
MVINRCKLLIVSLCLITCVLVLLTSSIAIAAKESRIALVIGNGAYKSSPLGNPVNDANDMAAALKNCNFRVMKSINASRREMRKAIRKFGKEINKGAVGLFYYAGHGIQVDGENYLVPVNAAVYTEAEVEDECLKVSSVLRQMESAGNRLNIIILDACRDNPFGRSFRSSNMGLAKMDAPTGSILAYATAPGSVAADGTDRNGLYTSMLLKHMMEPNLAIERVFKNVRVEVMKDSGMRQVPWESSSLTGDFYFNTKRGIAVARRPVDTGLDFERKRLEQERQEFKRIKAEIEERKRLETERKRIEAEKKKLLKKETPNYTSISPKISEPKIIARDGSYVKYATGVVYDKNTGLEWYAGPNKDRNWYLAKHWIKNLNVAGGGWRMPTRQELKTLYKKGAGPHNMTPLLQTTGWWVWSGETKGSSSAWNFGFGYGKEEWDTRSNAYFRSFAVRSRR